MWPIEGSRRRIAIAVLAVLALHAALIAALSRSWTMPRAAKAAQRVTLRIIPPAVPRPADSAPPTAAPPLAARAMPPRKTTTPHANEPRETPTTTTTSAAIRAPEPAASEPDALPSLIDTDATRRAIRASARMPSLGDQLARSREEPARQSADYRLAHGVKNAGKGDCAKGEYAGAGMGLLSLPFLAAAALSGDCAR